MQQGHIYNTIAWLLWSMQLLGKENLDLVLGKANGGSNTLYSLQEDKYEWFIG